MAGNPAFRRIGMSRRGVVVLIACIRQLRWQQRIEPEARHQSCPWLSAGAVTTSGNSAPTAKLAADASAAGSGRARKTSEMPSSSCA